jgi:hypothetical protein
MRNVRYLTMLATLAVVLGLVTGAQAGTKTAKPAYVEPAAPGVVVDPILSTGDILGDYQMSGIPDGLGAYAKTGQKRTFTVVMNHELGKSFPALPPGVDARISRLVVDRKTRSVEEAKYLFTGLEGFERFCSSTLAFIDGWPLYFTGEEAINAGGPPVGHNGSSIVLDPETGNWRETPQFGKLEHENVVPLKLSKWVVLTSEDNFRVGQPSYLFAYIVSLKRALGSHSGSLYVWRAVDWANKTGNATVAKDEAVPGEFVPISQSENATPESLKAAATARHAFKFDRLEDIAVRPDIQGRTYIADTGKQPATLRGRVYQFDINTDRPTKATLKMILNADAPDNDDMINPDNMDASSKVLVIQEDRESFARNEPNRVLTYDFATKSLTTVARVHSPGSGAPFNQESSGVIDVSRLLGADWWLIDVQAHNLRERQPGPSLEPDSSEGEDGQLLAIFIPNSTDSGR